jgi:hypothetical protein
VAEIAEPAEIAAWVETAQAVEIAPGTEMASPREMEPSGLVAAAHRKAPPESPMSSAR